MTNKEAAILIQKRKKELEDSFNFSVKNLIQTDSKLLEIEKKLRASYLLQAKGKSVSSLEIEKLEKQKQDILQKNGLKKPPTPSCKKCLDSAFTKNSYCDCVKKMAIQNSDSIELQPICFSKIDYQLFDAAHKERNKKFFEGIKKLCGLFPKNEMKIVLLYGSTGTGKTLLARCALNEFIKNDFSACAVTAYSFVERARKYHTSFNEEKESHLQPLLESQLLIIDDLGVEPILNNVTNEYLYIVLSERLKNGGLTIITTNLNEDEIMGRYSERISSRLFNKELSFRGKLGGKDLRK